MKQGYDDGTGGRKDEIFSIVSWRIFVRIFVRGVAGSYLASHTILGLCRALCAMRDRWRGTM